MKRIVIVFIFALVAAGLIFYMNLDPSMPTGYMSMSAVQAQTELARTREAHILDIRTPAEFAEGHIENAVNLDFYRQDFSNDLGKLDKNALYFIYCRSGNRSSQALAILNKLGFTRIWHLKDGINDWKREGLPLFR
ncbi:MULTISPECIES: rhodanese-like domain-containing protein [unclassified Pseudodesulfovibrio]|uniref:rhodanese-like domain-containing protein n=1 Tax=unclassified Pseudodesulfovibrio TaxID=2661612 RepID=UPI000FEBEEA4|nr:MULTISPECIES: rhodanese-like domain-containing protein [unclassified Pseudodesulfovibrio]MCJ2165896.1 rhodanese-like domain-containing protein [Pseudodesulfovibrio sp. S3-i]RWU02671.1 rhodanese-like domain-containing protein [Pseudodesulfovibrio sp. S3]